MLLQFARAAIKQRDITKQQRFCRLYRLYQRRRLQERSEADAKLQHHKSYPQKGEQAHAHGDAYQVARPSHHSII